MAINDKDIARFLAGEMPQNDPAWGEVAAFLQRLDAVYPASSTAALEADHLDAVIAEARHLQLSGALSANPAVAPAKPPRLAVASLAGAVLVLTVGVGAAAAVNGPLAGPSARTEVAAPSVSAPAAVKPSEAPPSPKKAEAEVAESDDDQQEPPSPVVAPALRHHSEHSDEPKVKPKPHPTPHQEVESDDQDGEDEADHQDSDSSEQHDQEDHQDEPGDD